MTYHCPHCNLTSTTRGAMAYHVKSCVYNPAIQERIKAALSRPDGSIITAQEYGRSSAALGLPSHATLRRAYESWAGVAEAYGLTVSDKNAVHSNYAAMADAYVSEELDRLYTRTMDFPLRTLPPKVKRLWCPFKHGYYTALVGVIR